MKDKIKNLIKNILAELRVEEADFIIEHPDDLRNGDFSSNVAMVCAKEAKVNPKELAEKIKKEIEKNLSEDFSKIEAVNGFLNFYLSRDFFKKNIEEILNKGKDYGKNELLFKKEIMVEYTDPNPFKPFHIGHLMTNAIGESIARILEFSGAIIGRANYQGDVGLHVAKAIYGLLQNEKLQSKAGSIALQARNIGEAYKIGAERYEVDEQAKAEIEEINKKIYTRNDEKINEIYNWGFDVTMEAFEDIYKVLGTKFDLYFLESVMAEIGLETVRANVGKVFEESEGAMVFRAEKYDPKLHTRVFVTSAGLPTYETKELGLIEEKFKTRPKMDMSITVTANEQMDYMRVVAKALSILHPEFENKMKHITHGMMRFVGGKMSSRKGNIITGESLLGDVRDMVLEKMTNRGFSPEEEEKIANDVSVAAIKYSILKQSTGGDIIYDFEKSISFEGDSGPYLQYAYTRASSVLEKAQKENILPDFEIAPEKIFEIEKLFYKFPGIVARSATEYEPHHLSSYLVELARSFNSFYTQNLIVDKEDQYSPYKIALAYAFSFVMKNGLQLLGIEAPKKM